jgi:hypothetical protein
MPRLTVAVAALVLARASAAQTPIALPELAEPNLARVQQALRADPTILAARSGATEYVLYEQHPDSSLVVVARFSDRRTLHLAGRARGEFVLSGGIPAGQISSARVFYYVVHKRTTGSSAGQLTGARS